MKTHHATIVLAIVFLTGLIVLWWAGYTGVDSTVSDAVLPGLRTTQVADIKRLEVLHPRKDDEKAGSTAAGRIVFERRGEGRWQMVEPFDVAADPSMVETLARNLKDMRKSIDAGTIHDPPGQFGLAPPSTTVRVFGGDPKSPLATLDVGRSVRDQLYVRPGGGEGIEVVDPRLLSMLGLSPVDWRDKALLHLPSFRVGSLEVGGPGRDLKVERDEGHWRLVRPIHALGDDDKVEGMVAELTSLRVAKGEDGFVANDLKGKDLASYGLDRPAMTIELRPAIGPGKAQILHVGRQVPQEPDLFYARAGDQDDVVLIDAKNFRDLGLDFNALRSKTVADLNPARVEFVRVEAFGRTFDLSRSATGWEQVRPSRETADTISVQRLLKQLADAQTSEFLDPSSVTPTQTGIDPPKMTISIWQAGPLAKPANGLDAPPKAGPRVVLQIGNYDALRKMLYARLEDDRTILAIPETFAEVLPKGPLAFRDRKILALGPTEIHKLTIRRAGTTYELAAPVEAGQSNRWRMLAPVKAAADEEAITKAVVILGDLRADAFVTDQIGDGKAYGLDAPALIVSWTKPAASSSAAAKGKEKDQAGTEIGTLRIGSKVPKTNQSYANIEGSPVVFTINSAVLEVFEAEFHTRRVLSFPATAARRLVLRWPGRTLAFKPQERPDGKGVNWVPEAGTDANGFDLSRLGPLVASLANLTTPRFVQYQGPIPAATGLDEPRLVIEVHTGDDRQPRVLRLGRTTPEQTLATTANEATGPVFLLTGPAWNDLVLFATRGAELPENIFAPEDGKATGGATQPPRP